MAADGFYAMGRILDPSTVFGHRSEVSAAIGHRLGRDRGNLVTECVLNYSSDTPPY
jgi:hypothetical protein